MKKLTVLLSGLAIFGSSMAFANTTTTTNTNAQKPPHKEPSAEVKKAMDECRASLGIAKKDTTNTGTKPAKPTAEQRQKMDDCMSKKGFKKPEGEPRKHPKKPEGQATTSTTNATKKTS